MRVHAKVPLPRSRRLWLSVGWAKVFDPSGMGVLMRAQMPGRWQLGRLSLMCHLVRTDDGLPDATADLRAAYKERQAQA